MGLALAILALQSLTVAAHETDQYTLPVGREFADLGRHFSRIVHAAIAEAVDDANAEIKRSLGDAGAADETTRLQSAQVIAGEVWQELFAAFPFAETLDASLAMENVRARYPGLVVVYRPEYSIYDDPVLLLDITKIVRTFVRASTVNVDGTLFGTDKIIHFINLGKIYYSAYLGAREEGLGEREAVSRAVQVSAGNDPFLSENASLGMLTTGIRSNADLVADYAGFKFYRNLTEEVRIGKRVMAPMLVREGPYWRLNDQVRPDSDFFTAFITPHWNEALNPNVYATVTDTRVRVQLRDRCPDLLDWYRDERGRRRSRQEFVAVEEELSTLYGEPYGYENDGDNEISIATTCFGPYSPVQKNGVSSGAGAGKSHTQKVLTQQTRGARRARIWAAASGPSGESDVDKFGRTRLWWAARHGQLGEVKRLLMDRENPNQADIDGEGPLHAAVRWGQTEVVLVLLSHGANINARSVYGMTPLHLAIEQAQLGTARALLMHGADANARNLFGRSPLHDAIASGNGELVSLLLRHGADPGTADDEGTTPLHLAARSGSAELVAALLSRGANPGARNVAGATPYDEAKRRGNNGLLRQLTHVNPIGP